MSNPNPEIHENPNIAEAGKNTQFGAEGGTDPRAAQKKSAEVQQAKWSTRAELKYLLAQDFSSDPAQLEAELQRLKETTTGRTSGARMLAIRMLEKALKLTETSMANAVIENVEGKLSQEIVIPNQKPAPENSSTLEEASAAYQEAMKTL